MTNFPFEMWSVSYDAGHSLVFFSAGTWAVIYAQYDQQTLGM